MSMDIVKHFEQRQEAMEGKAMIVCMSRRICVDLHNEIVKLKPGWYSKKDDKGIIKLIMTGSASDPQGWQEHVRTKPRRRELAERFKDPEETHLRLQLSGICGLPVLMHRAYIRCILINQCVVMD